MAVAKKTYKLDLFSVLTSIDQGNMNFYENLSEEEKKGYVPLLLMRYMSSLPSQNAQCGDAVIMVNDLVNVGHWELTKHPELQHKLMCITGLGRRQNRPWISKRKNVATKKLNEFFKQQYPDVNEDELEILINMYDKTSIKQLAIECGLTPEEAQVIAKEYANIE
jgi:hypothetical protein